MSCFRDLEVGYRRQLSRTLFYPDAIFLDVPVEAVSAVASIVAVKGASSGSYGVFAGEFSA